ncbi:hypothetical protein [Fluviispira multicolorata]|uniref:Leucine-rich repeat domain-containing protein n=1 Tax=Fluviispira multicolorata TaxID=2654512 RepID=A0A833N4W8_9BACT|nr:hypothetical protein [Fluviispira multicolorata]KAB8031868.1 hypothetical protein GCL57_04280 [Fluviispira multicolorata]
MKIRNLLFLKIGISTILILSCGKKNSDNQDGKSNDGSNKPIPEQSYESGETGKDLSFTVDSNVDKEMDVFIRYPNEKIKDKSAYLIDENLTQYRTAPHITWNLNEKNKFEGFPIRFSQKNKFNKIEFEYTPKNHNYFSPEYKICAQALNFNKENNTLNINGDIKIPLTTHTTCDIEVTAIETHKLTNKETRTPPIKFTVRLNYHFMDWCQYGDPRMMNRFIYTNSEGEYYRNQQCSITLFGDRPNSGYFNDKNIAFNNNDKNLLILDISPFQTFINAENIKIVKAGDGLSLTPLKKLKNLQELELSESNLTDISAIGELINLTNINFNYNKIENIAVIRNLINLKEIKLENNLIKDILPLGDLYKKSIAEKIEVSLNHNHINDFSSLQEISPFLKKCWRHCINDPYLNGSILDLEYQYNPNKENLKEKCEKQVSSLFTEHCPKSF